MGICRAFSLRELYIEELEKNMEKSLYLRYFMLVWSVVLL